MERFEVRRCPSGDGWNVWDTEGDCRTNDPDMTEGAAVEMAVWHTACAERMQQSQAEWDAWLLDATKGRG